jgi:hypothetical protein
MTPAKPVEGEREFLTRHLAHDYVKNGDLCSRRSAITAQQFCSIENLFARDGISKTTV